MSGNRDEAVWALIQSDRVSARTRAVLRERALPDDPAYEPAALAPSAFHTLRAVLDRVLPQSVIDLAQRLDKALAAGGGDGWRFADLPGDVEAYRCGLAALDAAAAVDGGFASLTVAAQDAMLVEVAAGRISQSGEFDPAMLQHWFEDLRSDAVKLYVAHPATFARMNYCGFAYGGDGALKQGFHALEPGSRESWEPIAGDIS